MISCLSKDALLLFDSVKPSQTNKNVLNMHCSNFYRYWTVSDANKKNTLVGFYFIKMYKRVWNESNIELSRLKYVRHILVNFFVSFDMVVFGWYLSTWFFRPFNWYSFDFDLIFIAAALNSKSNKTKTNAVLFSCRPAVLLEWFTHSSELNENNSI